MSILSRLFGKREARSDSQVFNLIDGGNPFAGVGHGTTETGPAQIEASATAVACIQAISSGLASLPPRLYRADAGGGRTEITDHPVARLLRRPSRHLPYCDLIEWLMSQVLLFGNGLLHVEADGAGRPVALVPVPWGGVNVIQTGSGKVRYLESDVVHVRDRSDNGIIGRARLARCPEVLAAARGSQQFAVQTFSQGTMPSGMLTIPPKITADGLKRLRANWEDRHAGSGNAGKVVYAEEGQEFTPFDISPESAQALQARRYSGEEVARVLGVPPAVIGDLQYGSFSNSETAGRFFGRFTLAPWACKLESALGRALLDPEGDYSIELDMSSLQRGNDTERWQSWGIAVDKGILDPADVREIEGFSARPVAPTKLPDPEGSAAGT